MSYPGPVRFVSEYQLAAAKGHRVTREILGRTITILHHKGHFHAFDSACFHMGGPLGESGDIEEVGNSTCIRCPWHGRKIDLRTGCQVETDLSGASCSSNDTKQRIYPTSKDSTGWIWIDLSSSHEGDVPSDRYNTSSTASSSQYGYGLGSVVNTGQGQDTEMETAMPLTPYAGIERRPMIPSPVKNSVPSQSNGQELQYRAQKSRSMRNANARMAVLRTMGSQKQASPAAEQTMKPPAQKTIQEMFARHATAASMQV